MSNHWYLHIIFWMLDWVVFSSYIIVVYLTASGVKAGWYNFQVDLGMVMMQYTIELEWKEPYEQEVKLAWMHQNPLDPCKCSQCFFCVHRMITGVIHKPKIVRRNFQLVARGHSQVHEKVIKTSAWDCQCHITSGMSSNPCHRKKSRGTRKNQQRLCSVHNHVQ